MQKHSHARSTFSGKIGFVLSAAGASVGLGNIWRFPYLAAKYGGGIFLLIYILLALTFGYTMIVAETSIGRMTGKSPVGAFQSFGRSRWLSAGGWLNAVIPMLIVPYYSVIGGWVIKYLAEYLLGNGHALAGDGYFSAFISSGLSTELCFIVFAAATLLIIYAGVRNGIERVSKLMMPILGLVRAKDFDDAVEKAVWLEHGNRHSAHIHSKNIDNITKYARAIDTAILVKNAPSYAALGFGGEGFCTFTIASRTGEGLTSTSTFTKRRRCVMSDSLCIR